MNAAQLYLSPTGRIGRSTWWIWLALPNILATVLIYNIDYSIGLDGQLASTWYVVTLWPIIAVSAKRWHDHDRSAWWLLTGLIPILGTLYNLIQCGLLRGTIGPNKFGPDPLMRTANDAL